MSSIGEQLKAAMKERGMNPIQVAVACGLTQATIYNVLKDKEIKCGTIGRLACGLKTSFVVD